MNSGRAAWVSVARRVSGRRRDVLVNILVGAFLGRWDGCVFVRGVV